MIHGKLMAVMIGVAMLAGVGCAGSDPFTIDPAWTFVQGGVTRGDRTRKELALIFTGGDKGEGSELILDTLLDNGVKASFFVTGGYVAAQGYGVWLRRMVDEGHYLGPHSHGHLLYAPWNDRRVTLVTEEQFKDDLRKNIDSLRGYGAMPMGEVIYFIPPYEWYNTRHAIWAHDLNCILFNFSTGSGSHRDWAPEGHETFRPSRKILADILECEQTDPDGLNGHLLLLHLGGEREDKMYRLLGDLIDALRERGYRFVRVDELLDPTRIKTHSP